MVSNRYTRLINSGKRRLGPIAGADYSFTVGRPPYINGNNTPIVVATGARFHIEPAGPNWTEDRIPDEEYFEICGNESLFQLGDMIYGVAEIPRITVMSKAAGQEFIGIKTARQCHISDLDFDATNLWFDFLNSTSAGPDEFPKDQMALNLPVRRAVMWALPGVTEGMKFWDDTGGWVWQIAKVDYKNFIMTLFLDEPNRT